MALSITSVFENNQPIPAKYTCEGENINPPLEISEIPDNTQSLSLIMHDPDAPMPGGFTHWIVFNIPAAISSIDENSQPEAVAGQNSAGDSAYTGPCPPSGAHRYYFRIYALDTMLELAEGANKAAVEKAMESHIIKQAETVGTYQKQLA